MARGKYKEASSSEGEEDSSDEPDLGSDEDSKGDASSSDSRSGSRSGSEDEAAAEDVGSTDLVPIEPGSKVRSHAHKTLDTLRHSYTPRAAPFRTHTTQHTMRTVMRALH